MHVFARKLYPKYILIFLYHLGRNKQKIEIIDYIILILGTFVSCNDFLSTFLSIDKGDKYQFLG